MAGSAERLRFLYNRFVTDTASPAEVEEFWTLLNAAGEEDPLYEPAMQLFNDAVPQSIGGKDWSAAWRRIMEQAEQEAPVVRLRSLRYRWWIAAASVLLLLLGGMWVYQQQTPKNDRTPAAVATNDVKAPASIRATLTLSDGSRVYLDAAGSGQLAAENGTQVMKTTDGRIVYQPSGEPGWEVHYHTLTNPRGSQVVDIELGDGSHVWLNAGSSITYPVAFGSERRVKMTGEAYFEIQKSTVRNQRIPFYVEANGTITEVLGTHFNVNAYEEEQVVRITLLEGAVAVKKGELHVKIVPGEQAIAGDQRLSKSGNVDMEQVMAWKNGQFVFAGDDIKSVMRQLSRWYDITVRYEGALPEEEFVGIISRSRYDNISSILRLLEGTGTFHFDLQGTNVTVTRSRQ